MEINILQLKEGAERAEGIAVIIDVFRAFTTACYIMNQNAETILPVADVELAYELKNLNKGYILVGERNEVMLPGFDYGNSPANIEHIDFSGKTVVHTTSAGTQGIQRAMRAKEVLTGSFVNAKAVADYIRGKKAEKVSLVCMGKASLRPTEEDTFCAEYIKSLLEGGEYPVEEKLKSLRYLEGKRFFNPENQRQCPQRDFYLSTQIGVFDFVLKAECIEKERNLYRLKKIEIR